MKMMHHPNMHHQPMSGHPPQHMGGHQGMPGHHQMPPHQMHRENRHVTLTRVPLGPSQAGAGMGGMGAAMGVPHHAPAQRPPHPIRAMTHHPPAQHHNVPPRGRFQQQMKPLRRPYVGGGYGPGGGVVHAYPQQQHHHQPQQPAPAVAAPQSALAAQAALHSGLRLSHSAMLKSQAKFTSAFAVSTSSSTATTTTSSTKIPEASANVSANASAKATVSASSSAGGAAGGAAGAGVAAAGACAGAEGGGAGAAAGDGEAARPAAAQANSKEKTPMCLVNELARYNKIKHQYRLTSETGPAHKKVFTVTLRLGDAEEYTAEGSSIKRAQHAAASAALTATDYPPPPPRAHPSHHTAHPHHRHSVMPTVELNALAMKLCQPAVYTSIPAVTSGGPCAAGPGVPALAGVGAAGAAGARGGGRGRGAGGFRAPLVGVYGRMVTPTLVYRVRVAVGGRAWLGEGGTPQAARHDAAARALRDLRPPQDPLVPPAAPAAAAAPHDRPDDANSDDDSGENGTDLLNSEVKSPVSLVHELALKRNLSVQFTVKSERGPPHMRVFVTVCSVGDMETEGEGNGKKVSKRRAAERMLDEMRRRWPAALLRTRPVRPDKRNHPTKKKPRNLIKEGNACGTGGASSAAASGAAAGDNPISLLAVARHVARARSPQYRVLEERGAARRREFLVRCDAPPHSATGLGPNKKTAKRRAAHNVLLAMEMSANNSNGSITPTNTSESNVINATDSKNTSPDVKQKEGDGANAEGRQPVPGVLLMDYHQRNHPLHNGVSESSAPATASGTTPGAKDQLLYLSQLLGFSVQFSDFPKRNHGEYLSLVSLSTEPPVMCHGGGASTAQSHEQCSRAALRALAMMGLDVPALPAPAPALPAPALTAPAPALPAPAPPAPTDNGIASLTSPGAKPPVLSNGITE